MKYHSATFNPFLSIRRLRNVHARYILALTIVIVASVHGLQCNHALQRSYLLKVVCKIYIIYYGKGDIICIAMFFIVYNHLHMIIAVLLFA